MSTPRHTSGYTRTGLLVWLTAIALLASPDGAVADDWLDWRGPTRDGRSVETGLPDSWSPDGENLAWTVPYGGRSAPVVMDGRLYLQNPVGEGPSRQERVMCFDADSGELLWEHRFNIYMSDVPPHRVAWASPVADPDTDGIFVLGVGGTLLSLSSDGTVRWELSLSERFGIVTTHGGRTVAPIIDGDLVIISGLTSAWGDLAIGRHRFMAFDKHTGDTVWVSTPGGRAFDTTYSTPIIGTVGDQRLLIAGGGDGTVHALHPQTGRPVWKYPMSKRGINTGVVLAGDVAIVSHGEENLDTSDMGLLAAIDARPTASGDTQPTTWRVPGFTAGYSSPVVDDDRVYHIDNSANLAAFDLATGTELWRLNLGTIQRAALVLADGKLYVGEVNGRFHILRPGRDGCEVLDQDQVGSLDDPEQIIGGVAVSNGRVYLVTDRATYAIGPTESRPGATSAPDDPPTATDATPTHLQIVPVEVVMPGDGTERFRARLYDATGRFVREATPQWSMDGLEGTVSSDGEFVPDSDSGTQAGRIVASVDGVEGAARVRVFQPLPVAFEFDAAPLDSGPPAPWIAASGKFRVRDMAGERVLVKLDDNPFTKRAKVYLGLPNAADFTIEADVLGTERRRRMGDVGVVAQRYSLVLFGNHQRLELMSWQPETERTIRMPFTWTPDAWYRLKLTVENLPDGTVRARGKAWPRDGAEPTEWMVERIDPLPNRQGSPGLYVDAHAEIALDNIRVTPN